MLVVGARVDLAARRLRCGDRGCILLDSLCPWPPCLETARHRVQLDLLGFRYLHYGVRFHPRIRGFYALVAGLLNPRPGQALNAVASILNAPNLTPFLPKLLAITSTAPLRHTHA